MNEFMKTVLKSWTSGIRSKSATGELDEVDWAKIVRNTLQVAGSAALASGAGYLGNELLNLDWGTVSIFAIPVIHFILDTITKKLQSNKK